jgi:hypothetical protein
MSANSEHQRIHIHQTKSGEEKVEELLALGMLALVDFEKMLV